jgi:hypothetical protein
MYDIFRFLATTQGQVARILAGLSLILLAAIRIQNKTLKWIIALIGLFPLSAGLLDKCLLAPIFGLPFEGEQLREELGVSQD